MDSPRRDPKRLTLLVVVAEILLATAVVVVGAWADRASRPDGPEAPVMAYAAALVRQDLSGAMDQLAPDLRGRAEPFVAWQLGNRYTILESVVRAEAPLDWLMGRPASPTRVVAVLEVQNEDGSHWRATEEMPVGPRDGRWYLLKVPLEPSN